MLSLALALVMAAFAAPASSSAAVAPGATAHSSAPALRNPGFEEEPFLRGWQVQFEARKGAAPRFSPGEAREGSRSLAIESADPADAAVTQKLFLPMGSLWRVTAWVKTEDLTVATGGFIEVGSIEGDVGSSAPSPATSPWHQVEATFRVASPGFIHLTLVGTRRSSGRVWFDGVALEPLATPDHDVVRLSATHATRRPIDAMQQGQFIEILCNLIPSIIAQQVLSTSFEEYPPCHVDYKKETDEPHRPWYPDGAVEVADYALDTVRPFHGLRSERISIPAEHARAGISQDGFYLRQGVRYKLHLHMRGEGGGQVRATLHAAGGIVAGPVTLGRAGADWAAADAEFAATRTVDNATLSLDFEGPGTLWLDRISLIGSDAVLGIWRPEVVAALKAMHPGIIRFGGSTTEDYEWTRGIGPTDERPSFSTVWGGLEENFVGIDEFVGLCHTVGAEPLICLRWTGKTPADAAAEVEYCNGAASTPWGAKRAANGHPEPYHVKFWQIGNEVGDPEYDRTVSSFAEAMRRVDPKIKLVSSFPTDTLLAAAGGEFDYLSPHQYEIVDLPHEERDFARLEQWITAHPGRDARISVTEWNTTAGDFGLPRGVMQTLGNALSVSRYLNLLQRRADLVEIANRSNFADSFGSGFVVTGPGWIYESPTYYAQKLYSRAAGSYPLRLERGSTLPWWQAEPDLAATIDASGRTLRIYGVNSTLQAINTKFEGLPGAVVSGTVYTLGDREHSMTAEVMNGRDQPERVSISSKPAAMRGREFEFKFEPLTVTLLELQLAH